jgi:hypothetical protein
MTPTKTLLISGAAAALLALGAVSYAATPAATGTTPAVTSEDGSGKMHRRHWRGRHGKHGRGFGRFCSDRHGRRFDRLTGVVEGLMTFTPVQDKAWKSLTSTMDTEKASIKKDCDELKAAGRPNTASQKLARMEKVLSSRLASLQRVRPAFDEFYATLNKKQKSAIDNLFPRRGRK